MAFATTTFVLSFYNSGVRGITVPNVIVGLALAYGGLAQLLAGMWEFAAGNTFAATVFCSYSTFWMSFAAIYWPGTGILAAYTSAADGAPVDGPAQLNQALGFYLLAWTLVSILFLIAALKSSVGLVATLFFLMHVDSVYTSIVSHKLTYLPCSVTLLLLTAHSFTGLAHPHLATAAGGVGVITAFCAYYVALAGLLTPDTSFFVIPVGPLGPPS